MTASPARRSALLAVLVLVTLGCLVAAALMVSTRGAGDGWGDRLESLSDDEAPASDRVKDREQLLRLASEFATRFNTYDESMLDEQGHLPEYAAVEDLMTPKFGGVFADNVGYAEETVAQLGAASVGTVRAVGVASQDDDSAEVLVAGTIELSYPYPEDGKPSQDGGQDGAAEDDPRVSTGPQRFRYQVSVVKIDGEWLVDDVDDVDDGLPSFSQPSIPEETPTGQPTSPPALPSEDPTAGESTEGEQ